jgi:hypothetical protein
MDSKRRTQEYPENKNDKDFDPVRGNVLHVYHEFLTLPDFKGGSS